MNNTPLEGYSIEESYLDEVTAQVSVMTPSLVVEAVKEDGDDEWAVTFTDRQHPGDYEIKTGRGLSVLKEALWAIAYIDEHAQGAWFADVEDPQRGRVYSRWIPASKIRVGLNN
jgi:hypothetical protein